MKRNRNKCRWLAAGVSDVIVFVTWGDVVQKAGRPISRHPGEKDDWPADGRYEHREGP